MFKDIFLVLVFYPYHPFRKSNAVLSGHHSMGKIGKTACRKGTLQEITAEPILIFEIRSIVFMLLEVL